MGKGGRSRNELVELEEVYTKKVEEKRKSLVHDKIINSDKIRTRIFF